MRKFLSVFCLVCCCKVAMAQKDIAMANDNKFICPYRPRIAEFTISNVYDYQAYAYSKQFGDKQVEFERERKIKARLGIPFVIKDKTLMGLQLKYDKQNFALEFKDNIPYELYDHVQTTNFTSLGGRFFLQQKLGEGKEISALVGAEIKSDKLTWNSNTSKIYASFNYRVQKNDRVKLGAGIGLAYTLGVPQVYPLFYYENQLNNNLTLDLALPKSAVLRYRASEKFYVSFKSELKGWRYAVHNNELLNEGTLTLRKSDLHLGVNFEHEIHDWLWAGVDIGYSKNLRYYLANPGDRRRDSIVDMQCTSAPYVNFSLFIVPPEKIYRKR